MAHRRASFAIRLALIACLLAGAVCYASADACTLNFAYYSRSALLNCLNSIPLTDAVRQGVLNNTQAQFELHAFADIVQVGQAPYNVEIDWQTTINSLRSQAFTSDFQFQMAVYNLVSSLRDGHFWFTMPAGYSKFRAFQPFQIASRLDNGNQIFYATPSLYRTVANFDYFCFVASITTCPNITAYWGQEIVSIDGTPIADYLVAQPGIWQDPGIALGDLIYGTGFGASGSSFPNEYFDVVFTGNASPVRFYNMFQTTEAIANIAAIQALNAPSSKKRSDGTLEDPVDSFERSILEDFESFLIDQPLTSLRRDVGSNNEHLDRALQAYESLRHSILSSSSSTSGDASSSSSSSAIPLAIRERTAMRALDHLSGLKFGNYKSNVDKFENKLSTISHRQLRDSTSSMDAAPLSLQTGNRTKLVQHGYDNSGAHWSYGDTSVFRLASFSPSANINLQNVLKNISTQAATLGLNNNLIIDTTNNGGGSLCLLNTLLAYLVPAWSSHEFTGPDVFLPPNDIRASSYADELFTKTNYFGSAIRIDTGLYWDDSVYTTKVHKTFGSGSTTASGNYSQKFFGDYCSPGDWMPAATFTFDKILIVTDGRCASSCAVFTNQLREYNRVRTLTYGGYWGTDKDSTGVHGGLVRSWASTLALAPSSSISWLKGYPTSSTSSFTLRQMYLAGDDIPRQFRRVASDFAVPYWDPSNLNYLNLNAYQTSELDILANLYESALPAFDQMPSGLVSAASPAAPVDAPTVPTDAPSGTTPTTTTPSDSPPTSGSPPSNGNAPTGAASQISTSSVLSFATVLLCLFFASI